MKRRSFIAAVGGTAVSWSLTAHAQQPARLRRVGFLMPFDPQDSFGRQIIEVLREGLQQHGWAEARNMESLVRWIGRDEERRRIYAAELVRAGPDVIFACFAAQLAALSRETQQIPLVFAGVTDPVGSGYVSSVARPGGNITGFTFFEFSLVGKWLELLKEVVPALTRVAVIVNPDTAQTYKSYLAQFAVVARNFKIEPASLLVHSARDVENAIEKFASQPQSGLIVLPDTFTADHRELIAALTLRHRLPAMFQFSQGARSGGLLSYGPDQIDVIRRSASYIARILNGEKPADLPVQAPTKYELVINLKTAKALGLEIPLLLQQRADEVIE